MRVVADGSRPSAFVRLAAAALTVVLIVGSVSPSEARRRRKAPAYSPPFAAMVVDAQTGTTLYARNEDALRHPASITKVMTLYLLFEQIEKGRYRLDSRLKMSAGAASQPPSKLGVEAGETIAVEDAIMALVTRSANDVASAIGENIAGSEHAFAEMMTRKARALGMARTIFTNASGLPDPEQVTTARDLIVLARAIQERFPRYYPYFARSSFRYDGAVIRNHNKLLGRVEGVDGIKTGFTRRSGFNLMTNARSDGRHIVAVVLGGRSGASRDRIMASLVAGNLRKASAGGRTAPMIADAAATETKSASLFDVFKARQAEQPASERVAQAFERQDVAPARQEKDAGARSKEQKSFDLAKVKPVVASADSSATTTPSAFRWIAGPQAQPRGQGHTQETVGSAAAQGSAAQGHSGQLATVQAVSRGGNGVPDQKLGEARVLDPRPFERGQKTTEATKPSPRHDDKVDPRPTGSAGWVIQLGAPDDEARARELLASAKSAARELRHAAPFTEKVVKGGTTFWRARFSGFDTAGAQAACKALKRNGFQCFATKG